MPDVYKEMEQMENTWEAFARRFSMYRYGGQGDIPGPRNLDWIKKEIFVPYDKYFRVGISILDVGCGNGRLNIFWKNYFKLIHCCDVTQPPHDKFLYDNVVWHVADFMSETLEFDRKFDMIAFFMSYFIVDRDDKFVIMEKTLKHLNDNGVIFIGECVTWEDTTRDRREVYDLQPVLDKYNLENRYFITGKPETKLSFLRRK